MRALEHRGRESGSRRTDLTERRTTHINHAGGERAKGVGRGEGGRGRVCWCGSGYEHAVMGTKTGCACCMEFDLGLRVVVMQSDAGGLNDMMHPLCGDP